MKKIATVLALFALSAPLFAGGSLETFDLTGNPPSVVPGHIKARVIPIRWDARSIPVRYSMNSTFTAVPNPLGAPVLTLAGATAAMQSSLDRWNAIPTSFIEMQVTNTVANAGLRGFDMKNEITFRTAAGFTAIASSPSVSLIRDASFVDGDDIDGDGDSDVSGAIAVAADVDGDGDIEFPAGFYKAGTILDNDVQFNTKTTNGFRFTVGDAAADTVTRSVDVECVAVHEFGHSFGLSHSMINQVSGTDGDGATMFPFIDTGDPRAEIAQREIGADDVAWASYLYSEGSASSGPAALQPGDVAFDSVYGLITGEVRHGRLHNAPIAGAAVFAVDRNSGEAVSGAFSGTTYLSYNPPTGQLFFVNQAFNIGDGRFVLPVPKGNYAVGVEAVDGAPVAATSISFTAQIGSFFGQQSFNEEYFAKNRETRLELRPEQATNVNVVAGKVHSGVDMVTNETLLNINNFGNRNFVGFTNSLPGAYRAVRIPASQVQAILPGEEIWIHGMAFETSVTDASVPAVFAEAILARGSVNANGSATIDLANPIRKSVNFVAQDNDFAYSWFQEPQELGRQIRAAMDAGEITDLFLVLRLPLTTPFGGVSNQAPFIGLDGTASATPNDFPIQNRSYVSNSGVVFTVDTRFNFRFSLLVGEPRK